MELCNSLVGNPGRSGQRLAYETTNPHDIFGAVVYMHCPFARNEAG